MRNINSLLGCAFLFGAISFALAANAADVEVTFYTPSIARIVRAPDGEVVKKADIVTAKPQKVKMSVLENDDAKTWKSAALSVRLDKKTGGLSFLRPDGSVMLEEAGPAKFKQETYKGGYTATKVSQRWKAAKDMPVYGLGSVQNGRFDQRNAGRLRLQPENCNDGIPFLCGVDGWGVYWDNVSVTWYSTDATSVGFASDVGDAEDYYFIAGGSLDGVVGAMRHLTGKVPMNALWSYGFWQSRERYTDCGKLLEVLRRYRKDGVPIDGIIQDWQYWGDNDHWNAMDFLNPGFAGAKEMIDEIHASNCHFIISIWCSFGPKTKPYADFEEHGELLALPTYPTVSRPYDCYSAEARERYWKHAAKLFGFGLDGWWMDSTEPEPWGQKEENNDEVVTALGRFRDVRLAYPFYAIRNVHDHTKAARPDRRVFILTRSASAGVQRTGAHTWSGDTDCTWEFLRKQIPCGLNFSLSGNPNWSNDLGGFKSAKRETFSELYARWMQYGVFQPMMRSHGTGIWRELYFFGKPGEPLYDSLLASVKLRYRFLPRIYSIAHEAYASNMSFMRPLVAEFPSDRRTWGENGSFLFGRDILVAPVTSSNVTSVATYLPQGADWYNYFTGERAKGGAEHEMKTDLSNFPLYVRAGAILVDGPDVQYVGEKPWDDLAVTVYPGADGSFELYEDAGDGYKYEKGEFTTIRFAWDDKTKTLTIGARKGAYPGMLKSRTFRVKTLGGAEKTVKYSGKAVKVSL